MKTKIEKFNKTLRENLKTDYPRVDEVVEAFIEMKNVAEDEIIAKLNNTSEVPVIDQNVVNAKALVIEFLTAQGYDAERYLASAERQIKLNKKFQKIA